MIGNNILKIKLLISEPIYEIEMQLLDKYPQYLFWSIILKS